VLPPVKLKKQEQHCFFVFADFKPGDTGVQLVMLKKYSEKAFKDP